MSWPMSPKSSVCNEKSSSQIHYKGKRLDRALNLIYMTQTYKMRVPYGCKHGT